MTDLEKKIVYFVNEMHRRYAYRYEMYQMLHDIRYKKKMDKEHITAIRNAYKDDSLEAAYELKTYYLENAILSNTIVLKMRPDTSNSKEMKTIKIHSDIDDTDYEYSHHVIEIFKEHGKYKVFDILHSDRVSWLEPYLDNICAVNHCSRQQLRYDMGYLAPAHAFAGNMKEFTDVMRYLDKKYRIGAPRINLCNLPNDTENCWLSDDIFMDFDKFGKEFNIDCEMVARVWRSIYDKIMAIKINTLHMLCLGQIMRDPIISIAMSKSLFDDEKICILLDELQNSEII